MKEMLNKIDIDKFKKIIINLAIIVTPFLFFINGNESTYTIKVIFLYLLCIIGVFVLKNKIEEIKWNFELTCGLLFLFFILISTMLSEHVSMAFYGNAYRNEGFLTFVCYIILMVIACSSDWIDKRFLKVYIVSVCLMGLYTIGQYFGSDIIFVDIFKTMKEYRMMGFMKNQNFNATYLLLGLILSTGIYVLYDIKKCLIPIAVIFISLLCTITRGCWLTFGFILVCMLVKVFKNKEQRRRVFVVIGICCLCYLGLNIASGGKIANRMQTIKNDLSDLDSDDAASGRTMIYKEVIGTFPDKILFGTGPDTLNQRIQKYNPEGYERILQRFGLIVDKAHCEPLEYLATCGIFTVVIYIVMVVTICWKLLMINDKKSLILLALVIGYFVQALFNISTVGVSQTYWIILGTSIYHIYQNRDNINCLKFKDFNKKLMIAYLPCGLVLVIRLLYDVYF